MKSREIAPDLIQLTRFNLVNAFLVREEDGLTLVDTMVKGSAKHLQEAAQVVGGPIRRIVLTHAHDDHTGALVALSEALPDAEVIASRRDSKLIHGDTSLEDGEPLGKIRGRYPKLEVEIDRKVEEGEQIRSLRVVATPGHSPGQIALLDERTGSLIAGDAYSTVLGPATTAGPYVGFPLPGFVTWHRPTALESARKLRRLDPTVLAVGHGQAISQPAAAMDRALARHD